MIFIQSEIEISNFKEEALEARYNEIHLRIKLQKNKNKWKLKEQELLNQIVSLQKTLEDNRNSLNEQMDQFSNVLKVIY